MIPGQAIHPGRLRLRDASNGVTRKTKRMMEISVFFNWQK
jgi:hypothetical protein